jgi:SAM-dependent methyltransferase
MMFHCSVAASVLRRGKSVNHEKEDLMSEDQDVYSSPLQVNTPSLDAMLSMFPWKPSFVLARSVEWAEIYKNRDRLRLPLLDLGCGTGEVSHLMYGEQRITGVDIDDVALQKAKVYLPDAVHGDARCLPFQEESFNSITSICVMEHLPEIDCCLSEIARVLRPGGMLLATVPSHEWKGMFFWNRFFSAIGLRGLGRRLADAYDQKLIHLNLLAEKEWSEKLGQVGLQLERIDPWLTRRATRFVSLIDSVRALPFPFPGFWTEFGTHFFIVGILRRLGGEAWWHKRFLNYIRPMFLQSCSEGEDAGGYVLIVRKPDRV